MTEDTKEDRRPKTNRTVNGRVALQKGGNRVHTNCRECPGRYGRDEGGSGGSGFVSHLISIRI